MRYINEDQRKAIFANLKGWMDRGLRRDGPGVKVPGGIDRKRFRLPKGSEPIGIPDMPQGKLPIIPIPDSPVKTPPMAPIGIPDLPRMPDITMPKSLNLPNVYIPPELRPVIPQEEQQPSSFAKTVTIQPGAPYPYSAEEVQRRREQEQMLAADRSRDGLIETGVEIGLGAGIGGLAGMALSAPPGGVTQNILYPAGAGAALGSLGGPIGMGVGGALGGAHGVLTNYPLMLPGAIAGGIAFPILFAKRPNEFSPEMGDERYDMLASDLFTNTRKDADKFFARNSTIDFDEDNEFAMYGGRPVEELIAEERAPKEESQPQIIIIQAPAPTAEIQSQRRGSGSGAVAGATVGTAVGAGLGGGAAMLAGQIPPLTVIPDELITVPLGMKVGGALGGLAGGTVGAVALE